MSPEDEVQRGHNARRILGDAMFQEAFDSIRDRLVSIIESADTAPDKRSRVNDLLVQHRKLRQYWQNVLEGGKMAAAQIEQDKNFPGRMRERFNI